jgi:hypothetical protein
VRTSVDKLRPLVDDEQTAHVPPEPSTLSIIVTLSVLIGALALIAAGVGVFSHEGEGVFQHTTARGESVDLYGRGIYYYDSVIKGAANRGTDALTLIVGIPLLVTTTVLSWRGSLRARLLLTGTLFYFLYVYATLAIGTAYNNLFLVYVALFSASLFAFVLSFTSINARTLGTRFSAHLPRRAPAAFMFAAGLVTLVIWLIDPVVALLRQQTPDLLENSTTLVTHALDLAIIIPAAFVAGILILRRATIGYLIAFSLLILLAMLAPIIGAQTAFQLAAGVSFTLAVIAGLIVSFALLGVVAIWMIASLLRHISDDTRA